VRASETSVDVGTLNGYRAALSLLDARQTRNRRVGMQQLSRIPAPGRYTQAEIRDRVRALGEWVQNMDLRGVPTAPHHVLGDYPHLKWRQFSELIPQDLTGRTVLDIGCNAGFYSIEMKRRGAERVVGIDTDGRYLAQARFAAEVTGAEIQFKQLSVFDVAKLREKFDLVLFMGVFHHLRHPLLALDLLHEHVAKDVLIFQGLQRGSKSVEPVAQDYPPSERDVFRRAGYPKMYFVEDKYSGDRTNWWIPNRAAVESMLRSSGFEIMSHPEEEIYICRREPISDGEPRAVYPERGEHD
jgi:tRNA (mo5U34)-methyltransferase